MYTRNILPLMNSFHVCVVIQLPITLCRPILEEDIGDDNSIDEDEDEDDLDNDGVNFDDESVEV